MDAKEAQKVMEYFRKGIPPIGYVKDYTVGRDDEIRKLMNHLNNQDSEAILLKANYGSGKTHLLHYIKEKAFYHKYAVSTVTLDARSSVRFNRMDQMLGSILRGLEIPNNGNYKGVRFFLDYVCEKINYSKNDDYWNKVSNRGKWDYSKILKSPALFIAIRAWLFGADDTKDLIEDWLLNPWKYYSQRKKLYFSLVENLRKYFRDPRFEWQFYSDGIFVFNIQGHAQSWEVIQDINNLSKKINLNGLVILFDEFEDVLENLRNINHQQSAFWNLFQFYSGARFNGKTFFAVTPSFVEKCKSRLLYKDIWDYDFTQFDRITTFEMSPLTEEELQKLALKIMETHGIAYRWEPDLSMKYKELEEIVAKASKVQVQDRARYTIKKIVYKLDDMYQEL